MAFIPVPNTCRAFMNFTLSGQNVGITLHCLKTAGGITLTDMNFLSTALNTWHTNHLKTIQSINCILTYIQITDLTTSSSPSITVPIASGAGTVSGTQVQNNVAAVVSHRSAQRGRSFRGRTYIPGLAQSQMLSPTTVTTAFQTAALSVFSNLVANLVAQGFEHVIASRFANNAARVTGVATPVTSYVIDSATDSQRRRLLYRGN